MAAIISSLIAYGPTKAEPESASNVVVGIAAILVFAGALLALGVRGRRAARRERR